jgi:SAM-dependent methyltransferase
MRNSNDSVNKNGDMKVNSGCGLCHGEADLFFETRDKKYYRCGQCSAIFLDPACYVSKENEKKRYEEHNNNVDDPGYRKFVEPIVSLIRERFNIKHKGLDFGSGTGPVIAKLLREKGYDVELYDPFFCDNPKALEKKYDFIICCEVIEHFHFPAKEFKLLKSLLSPGGMLFCMTDLYSEKTDFKNWYYKNDPTHVFFYHQSTLARIKSLSGFSSVENAGRITQFSF